MIEIQNKKVTDWVAECAAMTKPKEIVWIDGSEAQLDAIRALAVETGEMVKLNEEKLPGCYYYRTDPKDVARDEKRTVICTAEEKDAGPTNNWVQKDEMYRQSVLQNRHRNHRLHLCRAFHAHYDAHR